MLLTEYDAKKQRFMDIRDARAEGKVEGKAEGKAEAVIELLSECGNVPGWLRERVLSERDHDILKSWLKLAARVSTVEEFQSKIDQV